MRTIKFRYKVKGSGKLIYDRDENFGYLQQMRKLFSYNEDIKWVEDEMQSTGKLDDDGNEIYEGDIILYGGTEGIVKYDDDLCMFMANFKLTRSSWSFDSMDDVIKVIGNIYEGNY